MHSEFWPVVLSLALSTEVPVKDQNNKNLVYTWFGPFFEEYSCLQNQYQVLKLFR